ncbi:MAG TPA: hypothetical protein VMV34_06575 [Terriglobia bacterium]|nr:hypothetical protein [Terriglobia bacterium]
MVALTVDVWDAAGEVACRHIFYGQTEAAARHAFERHLASDEALQQAEDDDCIGEFSENIPSDEVPASEDYAEDIEAEELPDEDAVEIEAEEVED